MPLYAYKCKTCNKNFKVFHSSDETEKVCIVCSSQEIQKLLPTLRTVATSNDASSAQSRVEKFIEESRETLKQQLQESRKDYIP